MILGGLTSVEIQECTLANSAILLDDPNHFFSLNQ